MCKTWILQSYEDATRLNLRGKKSPMNLLRDTLLHSLSREKKKSTYQLQLAYQGTVWEKVETKERKKTLCCKII